MFNEPNEEPTESITDPEVRAAEKANEMRMHAELAAVFEGPRKFDAKLRNLDADLARTLQKHIGLLEKAKQVDSPVLPVMSWPDAEAILEFGGANELASNDYHVYRRPGEVMIARWLDDEHIDDFYNRMQAHANAALEHFRDEERAQEWKQDPNTILFLKVLDKIELNMAERYLRDPIREHGLCVLTTVTANEMNVAFLCDHLMGVPVEELLGHASTPPDQPSDADLAWFFKLFALRGTIRGVERMCFFTYLQKSDDSYDFDA